MDNYSEKLLKNIVVNQLYNYLITDVILIITNYITHGEFIDIIMDSIKYTADLKSMDHVSIGCGKIFITDRSIQNVIVYDEKNKMYDRRWFQNKIKHNDKIVVSPTCTCIDEIKKELYIIDCGITYKYCPIKNNTVKDKDLSHSIVVYNIINAKYVRTINIDSINPSKYVQLQCQKLDKKIINAIIIQKKMYIQFFYDDIIFVINPVNGILLYHFDCKKIIRERQHAPNNIDEFELISMAKYEKEFCVILKTKQQSLIAIFDSKGLFPSDENNNLTEIHIRTYCGEIVGVHRGKTYSNSYIRKSTPILIHDMQGKILDRWDLYDNTREHLYTYIGYSDYELIVHDNKLYVVEHSNRSLRIYNSLL